MKLTHAEKIFLGLSILSFIIVGFYFPYYAKSFLEGYFFVAVIFLTWCFKKVKPNEAEE